MTGGGGELERLALVSNRDREGGLAVVGPHEVQSVVGALDGDAPPAARAAGEADEGRWPVGGADRLLVPWLPVIGPQKVQGVVGALHGDAPSGARATGEPRDRRRPVRAAERLIAPRVPVHSRDEVQGVICTLGGGAPPSDGLCGCVASGDGTRGGHTRHAATSDPPHLVQLNHIRRSHSRARAVQRDLRGGRACPDCA
jgi:hypothetical protein